MADAFGRRGYRAKVSVGTPGHQPDHPSGDTSPPIGAERPERPQFAAHTPAPLVISVERPRHVSTALWLGQISAGALLFSALVMFIARSHLVNHLVGLLLARDVTVSSSEIEQGVGKVVLVGVGALAAVGAVESLILMALGRRTPGMRSTLAGFCVVHALAVGVVLLLLPRDSWPGWLVTGALAASVPLVLSALALATRSDISTWLRAGRAPVEVDRPINFPPAPRPPERS